MPLARMTSRRLMVVTALTAVVLAGACRVIGFRSRARFHQHEAEKVQDLLFYLAFSPAPAGFQQPPPPDVAAREIALWHSFRAYHERMRARYEAAACRPWIFVNPDSPAPKEPATLKAALKQVAAEATSQ